MDGYFPAPHSVLEWWLEGAVGRWGLRSELSKVQWTELDWELKEKHQWNHYGLKCNYLEEENPEHRK